MSGCNHDKCERDGCAKCCYCDKTLIEETASSNTADEFRKTYEYVNAETLEKAASENPMLVERLILDERVSKPARTEALYALLAEQSKSDTSAEPLDTRVSLWLADKLPHAMPDAFYEDFQEMLLKEVAAESTRSVDALPEVGLEALYRWSTEIEDQEAGQAIRRTITEVRSSRTQPDSSLKDRVYELETALEGVHRVYCNRLCWPEEKTDADHTERCQKISELLGKTTRQAGQEFQDSTSKDCKHDFDSIRNVDGKFVPACTHCRELETTQSAVEACRDWRHAQQILTAEADYIAEKAWKAALAWQASQSKSAVEQAGVTPSQTVPVASNSGVNGGRERADLPETTRSDYAKGYEDALNEAARLIWAERWEPPYTVENRVVKQIHELRDAFRDSKRDRWCPHSGANVADGCPLCYEETLT